MTATGRRHAALFSKRKYTVRIVLPGILVTMKE